MQHEMKNVKVTTIAKAIPKEDPVDLKSNQKKTWELVPSSVIPYKKVKVTLI